LIKKLNQAQTQLNIAHGMHTTVQERAETRKRKETHNTRLRYLVLHLKQTSEEERVEMRSQIMSAQQNNNATDASPTKERRVGEQTEYGTTNKLWLPLPQNCDKPDKLYLMKT
jgi:ERCC4-type nuclease